MGVSGPYLGQTAPTEKAQPFAPGLVNTPGWEYGLTFMPDLKEAYYLRNNAETDSHEMIRLIEMDGQWHSELYAPRRGQPVISASGERMHLGRRYRERTVDGWSAVKMLSAPFDEILIMRMSSSHQGTLFFDTFDENNESAPLRFSRLIDGKQETPRDLPGHINEGTFIAHPFIAPDESYLIWDADRPEGLGRSDLYISFREQDGRWGKAINMGDRVNSSLWEAAAGVSPDGKYLFFNRSINPENYDNVDIFWIDASIIDDLRPK